jgi:hypothetical protein
MSAAQRFFEVRGNPREVWAETKPPGLVRFVFRGPRGCTELLLSREALAAVSDIAEELLGDEQ